MRYLLLLACLPILCSCGTTINNQYDVTGNNNSFRCDSTAGLEKTIESSLGASIAATAAASQSGPATNASPAESTALEIKP